MLKIKVINNVNRVIYDNVCQIHSRCIAIPVLSLLHSQIRDLFLLMIYKIATPLLIRTLWYSLNQVSTYLLFQVPTQFTNLLATKYTCILSDLLNSLLISKISGPECSKCGNLDTYWYLPGLQALHGGPRHRDCEALGRMEGWSGPGQTGRREGEQGNHEKPLPVVGRVSGHVRL